MDDATTRSSSGRLKAFLIECSEPSWVDVAGHLRDSGIDVTYWTAWLQIQEGITRTCPGVLFHNSIDAKRAIPLPMFADAKSSLFSSVCQDIWKSEAQTVYDMMVRFDHSRDLIYTEASMLFYEQLLYWNTVLDRMRPDVVIFPTPPHVAYDYIILKLCERKGIPTLQFEQAWVFQPYSMTMWDFREGSVDLREQCARLMAGPRPVPLSSKGHEIIDRLAGHYSRARAPSERSYARTAAYYVDDETFWAKERRYLAGYVAIETKWYEQQFEGAGFREQVQVPYEKLVNVSALAKQRGVGLAGSFEGPMPNKHYLEQRRDQIRLSRQRFKDYQALTSAPQDNEPFIYMPLMFQPERTSCPQGGIFSTQTIMVNLLANLVPEGTWIYVKEHPTQLHPEVQSTQARADDFYTVLAGFKNVRLMDIEADPFELIDRCTAVATIGGSAALEAVARGKPALVFGYAYYNCCAGVYPVESEADLVKALAEISAHPTVDRADVEVFFHAIETSLFAGNADANLSTVSIDDNATNIAQEIVRRVSQTAGAKA